MWVEIFIKKQDFDLHRYINQKAMGEDFSISYNHAVWTSHFPLLHAFVVLGGGGEEDVAAGVEGGLDGVLHDTDDGADSDGLHGDVVADAEEGACHRNEQQRAASHA